MAVIETKNLTKVYGRGKDAFTALDNLYLTVNQGEIFGYLGPNGAGKTTTIRMFLDLIRPTQGSATILGMDAQKDSVELHKRIGFLPGELSLWRNERSIDVVRYFSKMRGGVGMAYAHELADKLQFDMSKRVRDYSTGNKRKLGLILALMHEPELLILDEPTSGLDPLMQQTFNQLMMDFKNAGRTVFLSSHVLSEVQAICDRVAILRHGDLKAVEDIEKLTKVEFRWVTVQFRDPVLGVSLLTHVTGVTDVSQKDETSVELRLMGDFDPLMRAIQDRYVVDLRTQEPTLEEIFLAFYDDSGDIPNTHRLNGQMNGQKTTAEAMKERA